MNAPRLGALCAVAVVALVLVMPTAVRGSADTSSSSSSWPGGDVVIQCGERGVVYRFPDDLGAVLDGCHRLLGSLHVEDATVTSLEPLVLQRIDGSLTITDSPRLTTLTGLDDLVAVGGGITVARCASLLNASALHNVGGALGGPLRIERTALRTLDGFDSLEEVPELVVIDNEALRSMCALCTLDTVGASESNEWPNLVAPGGGNETFGSVVAFANWELARRPCSSEPSFCAGDFDELVLVRIEVPLRRVLQPLALARAFEEAAMRAAVPPESIEIVGTSDFGRELTVTLRALTSANTTAKQHARALARELRRRSFSREVRESDAVCPAEECPPDQKCRKRVDPCRVDRVWRKTRRAETATSGAARRQRPTSLTLCVAVVAVALAAAVAGL